MGIQKIIEKIDVTRLQIESAVTNSFEPLVALGYQTHIESPAEYFGDRPDIDNLVKVNRRYWNRIWYVSCDLKDFPRPKHLRNIEFDITDIPKKKLFHWYHISVNKDRRGRGEGILLMKAMSLTALELGFEEIQLPGTPYLPVPREMYHGQTNKYGQCPNLLDWLENRFPALIGLRNRELNPDGSQKGSPGIIKVADILGNAA
jgi:hypothetical protein